MDHSKKNYQVIENWYRESEDFSTLMNYRVLRAGHLITKAKFSVKRHSVAGHELIFCLKGKGCIKIEGNDYQVESGQLAWLPVRNPHEHLSDPHIPWEILWIRIDGGKLDSLIKILNIERKPIFKFSHPEKIIQIYHDIFSTMKGHTLLDDARCDMLCSLLIFNLMENRSFQAENSTVITHRGLGRLIYQIHSYYNSDWDIEKFMFYCQVSKSQLFRLFHTTFNQTPLNWLKNYRLSQARRLLVETDERIGHIAWQVGYNDPLHFSRDFRRLIGLSPSKFRQKERENIFK